MRWIKGKHKILTIAVVLIFILLCSAMFVLNWMFEEDEADYVDSLPHMFEAKSILAVFAHPDDEISATGLLLKAGNSDEMLTAVITATEGKAGTLLPQISRKSDLGWVRKAEALKNTWAIGVDYHDVLDFPDGELHSIAIAKLVNEVRQRMLAYKPDLVVTFWPKSGFSNHADHKRMGLATEIAILELQSAPIDGYAGPKNIAYILAPTRMMNRFGGELGKLIVKNQPVANYAQDGEGWAKVRGWKIHASQADFVQYAYGLPVWFIYMLYDKEHYYVLEAENIPLREVSKN